ncbi:DEAD/DEAH box helicase, partial [Mycobacteroides abscessus]|uniref:DEAD/DEAH box helicase n=3 Tax=Mycobacteroides abscessus TaxID=36809 RepID=UPI0011AEA0C9
RNAVARVLAEPTTLLDHVVGAGKSGSMIMSAMELRRLGLVRQPWIVVPNHILEQIGREAKQWYPAAKILLGTSATDPEG